MGSRLLQLLLIFSLLLNSFVIAGFVYRSWIAPPAEVGLAPPPPPPPSGPTPRPGPLEVVTRELDLDQGQREVFRSLIEQHAAKRRERLQEIHRDREQVAAEMRRPQPDLAKVEGLIDRVSELRGELIKENLRTLAAFEPKLRPEQRERMYVIFADRFAGVPSTPQRPREPAAPRPPQ